MKSSLCEKFPSQYGVFSGPNFPVFSPNTGKYGPKKTPYLGTFHAVLCRQFPVCFSKFCCEE